MQKCNICPRKCNIDRSVNKGFCGQGDNIVVARAALHMWEEPCISGDKGSGTVFFSGCNLKCVYCQNHSISSLHNGKEITIDRLSEIFLELQDKGALNINLVTPTHYVYQIIEALKIAKDKGLVIPIVYNSSGYESVDTLKLLDGFIDIYLPDFKYYDDTYSIKYSNAPNYFNTASLAIDEMVRQVGKIEFDEFGIMKKGIIVRHLLLPGLINDSKKILDYLYNKYKDSIYISIMNQYTPLPHVKKYPELDRKVSDEEYDELIDYAIDLGITNAFIQEGETCLESFIPEFDNQGV
jgi:putative pyruvate formate lyase activating enzyme